MFKWKNRKAAVSQAAYEYIESRKRINQVIADMTPEDIEENRKLFNNPNWAPKFDAEGTFRDILDLVVGTGTRYKDYFCTDPENMPSRVYVQLLNDIKEEVINRDQMTRMLADWGMNPSNPKNSTKATYTGVTSLTAMGSEPQS